MKRNAVWTVVISALSVVLVACSSAPQNSAETPSSQQATVTNTIEQPPLGEKPQPTTPNSQTPEPSTASPTVEVVSPRYMRTDRGVFNTPSDPGQVAFSSEDASIQCEFRPIEENPPSNRGPSLDWRTGFAQGTCQFGDAQNSSYMAADTDPLNSPEFATQQSAISHVMPDYYTPLYQGRYIDLHTMACFSNSAQSIACMKYATGEAFSIDAEGARMLSASEVDALLDIGGGTQQVLSAVPFFTFDDGQMLSCFFEHPESTDFWCQSAGPALWNGTDNLVHFQILPDSLISLGTSAANPGLDYYRARQSVHSKSVLIDETLSVTNTGSQLNFRAPNGDSFWISANDFGLGV